MLEEITTPPWLREGHGPVPEKEEEDAPESWERRVLSYKEYVGTFSTAAPEAPREKDHGKELTSHCDSVFSPLLRTW